MRTAVIERKSRETQIQVQLNLEGTGQCHVKTGIGFFDHMLEQLTFHGQLDLEVVVQGDLHVDGHHSVEDVGICLGQATRQALGDKLGIRRYGFYYVPLDEALSRVVLDYSGRPGLFMRAQFTSGMVGGLDTQLVHEFFQGYANHALATIHIDNLFGDNAHHQIETIFKAFGRAKRMAIELDSHSQIPSTKGII
ncbi:MAG: imidazoleglycerol-phosphate dehydratase HisB [Gammaproteobacteria bacterium]|nr:imidazoleglycerol-phosphate dehydratase HisB [Gammaproteobacteria bacterium]